MFTHRNNILFFLSIFLGVFLAQSSCFAKTLTLAQQLLQFYEKIETISCEIQKVTKGDSTIRMLSRVIYKHPNHINIENISPTRRRIIVDGKRLYYYQKNATKGFSKPIEELNETWMASVRNIPGTPVEHLYKIKDIPENKIPGNKDYTIRVAYITDLICVVLSCNNPYLLEQIDFFRDKTMTNKFAQYKYSKYYEKNGEYAIPCLHEGYMILPDGKKIVENRYIHNLEVNKPINNNLFNANLFFKDVDFVDDFSKTFQ